jgi:hypothetical protein
MSDVPSLILAGIRDFAASRPRQLQREVGPSQLGSPCEHCLAAALAGWEKRETDVPWLALIGTAFHALMLESSINRAGEATKAAFDTGDWACEKRVTVGTVGGREVTGNADLFHFATGTVVDLKLVGASTLNEARRHGSKQQYRAQVNLYGKGFRNLGFEVRQTIVAYLPRNDIRLSSAFFDIQPYDEGVALDALVRANQLHAALATYERISVSARDVFVDSLPRSPGCYDCARYPSLVTAPSELAGFATDGSQT